MSRVDVIIPCYNYGHFLRECVESAVRQEDVDVRILIIDDASTDGSAEVGQQLAAEDERVQFRRHHANQGHIATYNEGLDWASGDYTLLLSADDALTPGAFGRAVRLMNEHPEVGFTFGRVIKTHQPDSRNCAGKQACRSRIMSGREVWKMSCEIGCSICSTPTAVVRTNLQKRIGGYRKELPHTADLEMWLRFAAHAPVAVLEAEQAFYRVHGKNMHYATFSQRLATMHEHVDAFEILFREHGAGFENPELLKRAAMRAIALDAVWAANTLFDQGDLVACQQLLSEAVRLFPPVKAERPWSRIRWKQRLGRRLMPPVRRLISVIRRPAPPADQSAIGTFGIFEKL